MGWRGWGVVRWRGCCCWAFLSLGPWTCWGDEPLAPPAPIRSSENAIPPVERVEPARVDSAPLPPPDAGTQGRDPVLEEIVRLRRTLGSPLQNDPQGERAFTDALRQLARPPALPPQLPPIGSTAPGDVIPKLPFPADTTQPDDVAVPAPRTLRGPTGNDVLVTLRSSSRELDMRAHDLDERRQYDTADRLRKLARQLRREARRLESEGEANSR